MLLALLYALLVGVGLLLTKVIEHSWLIREEDGVNRALEDGRTPTMNDVTYLLSGLGNTQAIIGAMVIVAIALRVASRRWSMSVFLVLAVSAQALVFLCVTLTIDRQRPHVKQLDTSPPTSSFPSGHTGAATALFLASALLVLWYVRKRWVKILGHHPAGGRSVARRLRPALPRHAPPDRRRRLLHQRPGLHRHRGDQRLRSLGARTRSTTAEPSLSATPARPG